MKIVLLLSLAVFSLVSAAGCRREEQKPMVQAQQLPAGHGVSSEKTAVKVIVPEEVRARWAAVKLTIEDKSAVNKQDITVRPNTEIKMPGSSLRVVVGDFLPDFRMDTGLITSASNEPNNPAVGIRVFEGDAQIFPAPDKQWGWLFSRMPSIHSFEHKRYGLTLKEGIEKKD